MRTYKLTYVASERENNMRFGNKYAITLDTLSVKRLYSKDNTDKQSETKISC